MWADVLWYFLVPLQVQYILNPEGPKAQPGTSAMESPCPPSGLPPFVLLTSSIRPHYFANSRVMSCLLPAGTLCACDISTLCPRPAYGSLRRFQARLERSCPCAASAACAVFPHHPAALIGNSVPFCLTTCLILSPRITSLRKDLINSFSLRRKWLVLLMGLFPRALLSFGASCEE